MTDLYMVKAGMKKLLSVQSGANWSMF